jgi:hypothetical protein
MRRILTPRVEGVVHGHVVLRSRSGRCSTSTVYVLIRNVDHLFLVARLTVTPSHTQAQHDSEPRLLIFIKGYRMVV